MKDEIKLNGYGETMEFTLTDKRILNQNKDESN